MAGIEDHNKLSSSTSPDFIDNLLRYLDDRSRNTMGQSLQVQQTLKKEK
jgi:hypothetical protein